MFLLLGFLDGGHEGFHQSFFKLGSFESLGGSAGGLEIGGALGLGGALRRE